MPHHALTIRLRPVSTVQPRKLSEELADLRTSAGERALTLREGILTLGGRAYLLLVLLLAMPFITPIPIPGLSTPFGLAIALIAFRLSLGQRPLLSKNLQRKVLPADYIRTARLKGLTERAILRRHALRNALLPIISLIGLSFPALLTGAVFIERVFAWPGMGYALVNAIESRDYPLVVGSVIIGSVMVMLGSFLADMLYAWADPRLRAG